jgi:hypothetical protein
MACDAQWALRPSFYCSKQWRWQLPWTPLLMISENPYWVWNTFRIFGIKYTCIWHAIHIVLGMDVHKSMHFFHIQIHKYIQMWQTLTITSTANLWHHCPYLYVAMCIQRVSRVTTTSDKTSQNFNRYQRWNYLQCYEMSLDRRTVKNVNIASRWIYLQC